MSETFGAPEEIPAAPDGPPEAPPTSGAMTVAPAEFAAPEESPTPPAAEPESAPVSDAAPAPSPPARQPQRPPDAARCHRGLRAPVLEVWRHLTRPELQRRWFGDAEIELTVGGEFSLHAWNGDVVRGRVLLADPPSTLAFTWKQQGASAESRVTIRLRGDGPGSNVSLRHEGLGSEPERRQARRLWREVLAALRTAVHEDRDAHEWGSSLPISVRAPLARTVADIWPLLSTAPGLGKWIGHVERFDAVPEGLFRVTSRAHGRDVVEEGAIEQMVENSRVVLGWEWIGESWGARTKVELTLEADPSGSALLLLHSGFDRIAPAQAASARRHYAATWPKLVANLRRLVAPVHA